MVHVSPSQIEKWDMCKRAWGYSRVRPRTMNRYAAFGDGTHKILEDWLQYGTPPDPQTPEGRCALAGLPLLPMPGQGIVEHSFRVVIAGVVYVGRIDLLFGYVPGQMIVVWDHKTTGNFCNAKAPGHADPSKDLITDPQRVIYSHIVAETLGVENVTACWGYLRRNPPAAHPVPYLDSRAMIAARFWEIHYRSVVPLIEAAKALEMAPEATIKSLPRTLTACGNYGGCPYRDECLSDISPLQRAGAILSNPKPIHKVTT